LPGPNNREKRSTCGMINMSTLTFTGQWYMNALLSSAVQQKGTVPAAIHATPMSKRAASQYFLSISNIYRQTQQHFYFLILLLFYDMFRLYMATIIR
jgi:hypothetical protein